MKPQAMSLSGAMSFVDRQQRDWKVTVTRTSLDRLAYQMVFPYLSIYILALGATATQLGLAISIGMGIAGLLGPFTGWFMDRIGPKLVYLLGIAILAVSYSIYGLAPNWIFGLTGMIAYWLGHSFSMHSCSTVCGNCLPNEDRATGMTLCETVAAGLLGMAGPIIGAFLVSFFGGINVDGIRPIFFAAFAVTLGTFAFVLTQLAGRPPKSAAKVPPNLFKDLRQVLNEGHNLKRWLVIASVGSLPLGMVLPFSQVYAHTVKGADEFVLGAMVAGSALSSIAFAIPLGRLADKVGRKKSLYLAIPIFWASNILLVWGANPALLVAAGVLQGFYYIYGPISAAMERELVPAEQMGRWLGIARLFRMLLNAGLTSISGLLWDQVGPQSVFLIFVVIDLVVRMPLLVSMPETLRFHFNRRALVSSESEVA